MSNVKEEYYFLTEKLDEINWALNGSCNDIDCDKYMYKDILKKRYKPVLKHGFSCMTSLKIEQEACLRILSLKRYKIYRYKKCQVCGKSLDKLSNKSVVVVFKRLIKNHKAYQLKFIDAHRSCKKKAITPKGWDKGF